MGGGQVLPLRLRGACSLGEASLALTSFDIQPAVGVGLFHLGLFQWVSVNSSCF